MEIAYISVGSNMGDGQANCLKGIGAVEGHPLVTLTGRSRFYRTQPVDYTDQDWFVNAAIRIETTLSPVDLLNLLQKIETDTGTTPKSVRFGPRLLDLDILLYGNHIIDLPDLLVPHPRMDKRHFVLKPLCDIDAHIIHPQRGVTVYDLLMALDDTDQQIQQIMEL